MLRRQGRDTRTNVLRLSHDSRASTFDMIKTFATSSRQMTMLAILLRQSHESRAKGPPLNSHNSREEFACQSGISLRQNHMCLKGCHISFKKLLPLSGNNDKMCFALNEESCKEKENKDNVIAIKIRLVPIPRLQAFIS